MAMHWTEGWILMPVLALAFGLAALAPLGAQVLARGVVFIDLAVAQAAAAAALGIGAWQPAAGPLATRLAAALGALLCAGVVCWLARRWPAQREALIGLVYVAAACIAILAVRLDPHGGERIAGLLAADVLWAGAEQVGLLALCAIGVEGLARRRPDVLARDAGFYPVFAIVASLAVPVLGLLLVFASLIAPALWQRAGMRPMVATFAMTIVAALGLAASWAFDAPSGACVALALATAGVAVIGRGADGLSTRPR